MGPPAISRSRSGEGGSPVALPPKMLRSGLRMGAGASQPSEAPVTASELLARRRSAARIGAGVGAGVGVGTGGVGAGVTGSTVFSGSLAVRAGSARLAADRSARAAGVRVGAVSGVGGGGVGAVSGGASVTSISTGGASIGRSAARVRMGMRRSAAAITTCETPDTIHVAEELRMARLEGASLTSGEPHTTAPLFLRDREAAQRERLPKGNAGGPLLVPLAPPPPPPPEPRRMRQPRVTRVMPVTPTSGVKRARVSAP